MVAELWPTCFARPSSSQKCLYPRPESTQRERAVCLGLFDKSLARIAKSMNIGDVYAFIPCAEEDYIHKVQKHGWTEIPSVRLFKKSTGVSVDSGTQ